MPRSIYNKPRQVMARVSYVWGILCILCIILIHISLRNDSQAQPTGLGKLLPPKACEGASAVLDVTSERMTVDSKHHTFVFEEKVHVRRCDMTLTCDRLQVINDENDKHVEQIVAIGNVRFQQGSRYAVAERANYFEAEQKLLLTGNPRAWDTQEQNELTGEEITIFLREDKMLVKQARVLFPLRKAPLKAP